MIDIEAREFINQCYERTKQLILEHREKMDVVAHELLKKEILYRKDFVKLIGERPFEEN